MRKTILITFILSIMLLATAVGCRKTESQQSTADEPAPSLPILKVGMMSAVDAAPFYVALDKGYYQEAGVDVQLILFTNGQHRQTALQTAQVDGAMTDLVALTTQTASDFKLTGTLSTDGDFPLLATGNLEGKEAISVGTMEISVTNYLVEQYLGKDHALEKVFINEIPARLEAVVSGQLDAGIFPEPFASIGALRGLEKLFYEGIPAESLNIIAFTDTAITQKADALKRFHTAYAKAVADIQQDEGLARSALMKHIPNLPPDIRDTIRLPQYHTPRLPSDEFVNHIMQWTATVTGKTYGMKPSDMLDPRFIQGL